MQLSTRMQGIIMVIVGACLWGASGVAVQYLLQYKGLNPEGMLFIRMFMTAPVFLAYEAYRGEKIGREFWSKPHTFWKVLKFAFFGMFLMQYPFFVAIGGSNAATATVLQYLMPVFLVLYTLWQTKVLPSKRELQAVVLAMLGTFLMVTKGDPTNLALSPMIIFWGVLSGIGMAVYTAYAKVLMAEYSCLSLLGWGSLFTGCIIYLLTDPFPLVGLWDWETVAVFSVLMIFGTFISFSLYLGSTKYISATEAGTLASVEPLASFVCVYLLLPVEFSWAEIFGIMSIIGTVFILSRAK